MRAFPISAALTAGLAALAASPAQAADRYDRHRSSFGFSITVGDPPPRHGYGYGYSGPRHHYWREYPSYGYGYRRHPGYDYVRRNYYRGGHACFWDYDRQRVSRHDWAIVRELNCYARHGRIYEIPQSRQIVRYIPGRPYYDRYDRW